MSEAKRMTSGQSAETIMQVAPLLKHIVSHQRQLIEEAGWGVSREKLQRGWVLFILKDPNAFLIFANSGAPLRLKRTAREDFSDLKAAVEVSNPGNVTIYESIVPAVPDSTKSWTRTLGYKPESMLLDEEELQTLLENLATALVAALYEPNEEMKDKRHERYERKKAKKAKSE